MKTQNNIMSKGMVIMKVDVIKRVHEANKNTTDQEELHNGEAGVSIHFMEVKSGGFLSSANEDETVVWTRILLQSDQSLRWVHFIC